MSAPTQAQIEAAARELKRHTMPDGYSQPQRWLDIAAAALTAAAEMREENEEAILARWEKKYADALQKIKADAIERCAQVDIVAILKREIRIVTFEQDGEFSCKIKDGNLEHCAEQIAAAIRALDQNNVR